MKALLLAGLMPVVLAGASATAQQAALPGAPRRPPAPHLRR